MSYKLISSILRSPWYIDSDFVIAHASLVANLLTKGHVPVPGELAEEVSRMPYVVGASNAVSLPGNMRMGYDYDNAPKGAVAVIPVKGVLLKEDQNDGCGYFVAGMSTIALRLQEADNHQNIAGIILHVDTPGGTVDGTQVLADAIKNLQKPVVAFVDYMAGSAGYYIASSADHIIAQNTSALIGSIGTMISFADQQPYFEKMGVKFHNIVSDLSPDKNSDFAAAREGDYKPIKQNMLNPYAKIFQDYVVANRPQLKGDTLQGKVFLAEEALTRGLIDSIGPMEDAVLKLKELAQARQSIPSNYKPKNSMENLPLLIALLAVETLESTDEGVFLNQEQLASIEQRLAAAAIADSSLATASTTLADVQGQLAAANDTITERDARIVALAKGPAVIPAAVKTENDKPVDSADDFINSCASLSTGDAIALLRKSGI